MEEFGDRHAIAERIPEGEPPMRPPLARLLQDEGLATRENIEQALTEGERTGERLGEVLLRWQLVDERQLALLLARQWQLPFLDEHELVPEAAAVAMLAPEDAHQIEALPVRWEGGVLQVAVAEPTEERLAEARARIPQVVDFGVVTHGVLTRLLPQGELPATESAREIVAEGEPAPTGQAPSEDGPGFDEQPGSLDEHVTAGVEPPAVQTPPGEEPELDKLLDSLDEETAQLSALREQVQRLAAFIAERDQTATRLEAQLEAARAERDQTATRLEAQLDAARAESDQAATRLETQLDAARAEREQDLRTIEHLKAELGERDRLLTLVDARVQELVNALGARRGG
jgi:MshEN domain